MSNYQILKRNLTKFITNIQPLRIRNNETGGVTPQTVSATKRVG